MRCNGLPQAIKNILPALGNEFVTIIKDSSLLQPSRSWNCGMVHKLFNNDLLDFDAALVHSLLLFDCDNSYDGTLETQMEQRLGEGRK